MIRQTLFGPEIIESKVCIKCGEEQPLDEFSIRNNKKERRNDCRKCHSVNKKLIRTLQKENAYPDKDYRCPICHRSEDEVKDSFSNRRAWALDHDHKTGKFRGWVCNMCNIGLSRFDDNVETMTRAIVYLRRDCVGESGK